MPRNNPNYKLARDALMRNFERELNFDENLLAGIYTVKANSLNVKCEFYTIFLLSCSPDPTTNSENMNLYCREHLDR